MQSHSKQSYKRNEPDTHSLTVYNCGTQSCEPAYTWGPGIRDHFLIHLVTAGKGRYEVNGTCYPLSTGDLFLARPNQVIVYRADEETPWEYSWVGFNGAYAHTLVQSLPFSKAEPCYHTANHTGLEAALHQIHTSWGPTLMHETRTTGFLSLFLALLMEEGNKAPGKSSDLNSQYISSAVKYIQYNYSQDITVDDIANAVGLSRSHLYRVFMNTIGHTPIDYLTEYRIGEACTLLKNSTLSIAEIACSVGFFDQFYFSRVFKKIKGLPPSKYVGGMKGGH